MKLKIALSCLIKTSMEHLQISQLVCSVKGSKALILPILVSLSLIEVSKRFKILNRSLREVTMEIVEGGSLSSPLVNLSLKEDRVNSRLLASKTRTQFLRKLSILCRPHQNLKLTAGSIRRSYLITWHTME